jgi:hypothetical protein
MSVNKKILIFTLWFLLIIPAFLPLTGSVCNAENYTWTGKYGSDWSDPTNWRPAGVPGSADKAIIPGNAANQPKITGYVSIGELDIESNASLMIDTPTGGLQVFGNALIAGSLSFSKGSFRSSGCTVAAGGTVSISGDAIFELGMDKICSVSNGGRLNLSGGFVSFDYNAILENNGVIVCTGCEIRPLAANSCILNNNGELNIKTGSTKKFTDCVLTNNGTMNLSDSVTVSSSTDITNNSILNWTAGGFAVQSLLPPSPPPSPFIFKNNKEIIINGTDSKSVAYCVFINEATGMIDFASDSILSVSGDNKSRFDNKGVITGGGMLEFSFPSPDIPMPPLKNSGTLRPGGDGHTDKFTIKGKYEQTEGGVLEIEIKNQNEYDVLILNGDIVFNGVLEVKLSEGESIGGTDIYHVVTYSGAHSGSFSSVNLPKLVGHKFGIVEYLSGPSGAAELPVVKK